MVYVEDVDGVLALVDAASSVLRTRSRHCFCAVTSQPTSAANITAGKASCASAGSDGLRDAGATGKDIQRWAICSQPSTSLGLRGSGPM